MILHRGRREWTQEILSANDFIESKLLPGFRLACRLVLDAGRQR
jgi:hypothetical protein